MNELNKAIRKHNENSKKLKEIYLGNSKLSYEKSLELQQQQGEEYNKLQFLLNLRKEMLKNNNK